MQQFYDYIETMLPSSISDENLFKFKKDILDKMLEREKELTLRGLKDKKVIADLVISENSGIVAEYQKYAAEKLEAKRRRQFALTNIIGSAVYLLTLIIVFLGVSMATHQWGDTWVIVVDGILIWVAYIISLIINRVLEMKRFFHFIARLLLAGDVMIITVAVFLFFVGVIEMPKSWLILIFGVMSMFICDAVFASITKEKLAILFWICYIPAIFTMIFIIVCALGYLPWSVGWIMIPLSLLLDLIIAIVKINQNSAVEREVIDSWNAD